MLDTYYKINNTVHKLSWGALIKGVDGADLFKKLTLGCSQVNSFLPEGSGYIPDFNWSEVETSDSNSVKTFIDTVGSATVELFTDSKCKTSFGYEITHTLNSNVHEVYLRPVKYRDVYFNRYLMVARLTKADIDNDAYRFVSPYASSDGTLTAFMKNMWTFEHEQFKDGTPDSVYIMGEHCCSTPFAVVAKSKLSVKFYVVGSLAYSPAVSHVWDNYASHYTIIFDTPLVPVDNMVIGDNKFRPASLYSPKYLERWNWSDYGYDSVIAVHSQSKDIPAGLSDVNINYTDSHGSSVKKAKRFLACYVQLPSALIGASINDDWSHGINFSNTNTNDVKFIYTATDNNKLAGIGITHVPSYSKSYDNTMCFAQLMPFNNLSKEARDAGDSTKLWKHKVGDNKIPSIIGLSLSFDTDINAGIVNLNKYYQAPACLGLFTYDDVTPLSGNDMFSFFYDNEVQDWNPPQKPSEIPDDDGNGGFNNSDNLGGNGSWQDTTTDMSYDKNNPLWNTPDNLGLDGNYDIVKLNRASVELLAEQTWTKGGWLSYVSEMSNISRAGDGVVDFKTCFAEIPTTGDANIVAIAGFGIKQPIPCRRVNQYNQFNMGTVNVPVYFGSFLDYAPYTEIVLELPFAQPVKIPPEVVVGQTINLTLSVDLMSSTAMYIITCGGRLLAQVPANIFITLPFAASEYTEGALSAVSNYVAQAGNIGADIARSAQKSAATPDASINPTQAVMQGVSSASAAVHEVTSRGESRNITQISQGGGGGAVGAMGLKYATLKITRPYVTIPPRYYELQGCPSGFVKRVGDCKGYLEVEQIYGSIPCNTDEFNAIVSQLKGGIFP